MRTMPEAAEPRWLLVVGAPPAGIPSPPRLRDALRAGVAARAEALFDGPGEPNDDDGRESALEER